MTDTDPLLNNRAEMWARIEDAIAKSNLFVDVVRDVDETAALDTMRALGLPAGATLGSILCNTGGINLEGDRLRFLGSPKDDRRGLQSWNDQMQSGAASGILYVADDIYGNFYAVNLGGIDEAADRLGAVYALCPTYLDWVLLADKFSYFFFDVLDGFWGTLLGKMGLSGVRLETSDAPLRDLAASYYPPLFSEEGSVEGSSVKLVPVFEALPVARDVRSALGL